MTVGTRMWSEQPVHTPIERFRVPSPTPVKPLIPPSAMTYVDIDSDIGGAPLTLTINLTAGQQALLVVSSNAGQPITVAAGWTVLSQEGYSSMLYAVITRKVTVTGTYNVATAGPEAHPFNRLVATGFVFTSTIDYTFTPSIIARTVANTVTMHAWGGASSAYRMRALVTRGMYNNWIGNGADSGHAQSQLGYLSAKTSWWQPWTIGSNPEAYLLGNFPAGTWTHDSIGVAGVPTWVEYHIGMEPA